MEDSALIKIIPEILSNQHGIKERKVINTYNGYHADKPVFSWIKEAEDIATLNNWDDKTKRRLRTRQRIHINLAH